MCVIIDTNTLSCVFNPKDERHEDFLPVLNWIVKGKGKLIMGGSKYMKELSRARKFLPIINKLKKSSKVYIADKDKVDTKENEIKARIPDPDFDDPHLPAIAIVGKCKVICTCDTRSYRFVTNRALYSQKSDIPKYYSKKKNAVLLTDKYVHDYHKPLTTLNKKAISQIGEVIDAQ